MKLGTILEKIFKLTGIAWIVEKLWGMTADVKKEKKN